MASSQDSSNSKTPPNLLTVKETAEYLRIPIPTVYYLVQRGQLPAIQIGGRWRIKKDPLDSEVLKLQGNEGEPKLPKEKTSSSNILIIDDQADILELLVMALSSKGYSADTGLDGKTAVDKLKSKKYDVLFLDMNLPDMSGEEVFERAIEIQPEIHVVVMTGVSTVKNLENILALGPVTVLQKPFKMDQLLRITQVILGQTETDRAES